MIPVTDILTILAGLTALGVGADVILNYLLKSQAVTATNAVVSVSTTAINAINATTQTAVNAILNASELHDVYSISKEKIQAQSGSSSQAQAQAQSK